MKKNYNFVAISALILVFVLSSGNVFSQAFRKGSLVIGISEGSTWASYSTSDVTTGKPRVKKCIDGVRDPIVIEYGISDRWSFGLCSGNDIFKVNGADFYGKRNSDPVKVSTSEFTFDANYHVFVNKRLDVSLFTSLGGFSIKIKGNDNDMAYYHESKGNMVRVGTRARYYFWKRLGAFGMISSYIAHCSPKDVKGNTFGQNFATTLNGFAIESGLCFRILR